jgi:hypothetical protein
MRLLAVQGKELCGRSFGDAMLQLKQAGRPLALRFTEYAAPAGVPRPAANGARGEHVEAEASWMHGGTLVDIVRREAAARAAAEQRCAALCLQLQQLELMCKLFVGGLPTEMGLDFAAEHSPLETVLRCQSAKQWCSRVPATVGLRMFHEVFTREHHYRRELSEEFFAEQVRGSCPFCCITPHEHAARRLRWCVDRRAPPSFASSRSSPRARS